MSSAPAHPDANGHANGEHNVELADMGDKKPSLPIEEDIMQLSRLGEIGAIQKLFDSGKYDATYSDEQGITPLHWAAINNHYALCHFLIQSGANVNAKGGDAVATPVLWAAKRCNYYVVNLLLEHGADPLLTDDQGFNLLHSATFDGNVFQLVLLLHQDIPVDIPDAQAHTALMWAAYKGYSACVDLFLRWGANVNATDDSGFTALHWAIVSGSQGCIQKLIEYGADRFAKQADGKTPAMTAEEMSHTKQWHRALAQTGYNKDGTPKEFPIPGINDTRWFVSRFIFFWPFLMILFCIFILSHFPVYVGIPLTLVVAYGMQWAAQYFLRWAPSNMKHIHDTPFLAGIFAGTLFWVGVRWITTVLPYTIRTNFFLNLLFGTFFGLTTYFYFFTMASDPGYVPKAASRSASKAVIDELMESRQFDERHFCVQCMVRRPLRSKHCKRCERCVAKTDHHCPWVNNCVANNNHRHFVFYVASMEIGVLLWVRLILQYLENVASPEGAQCNVLPDDICQILHKDPFTIVLTIWAALQLTWVTMLLIVQLLQIGRNLTTYESMRGHLHSHTPADALNSFVTTGDISQEDVAGPAATGEGVPAQRPKQSIWDQWKRLLGLDTFVATAVRGSRANQARSRGNPFSRGVVTNCKDFFCDSAPLFKNRESGYAQLGGERVDYTRMYELPKMRYQSQRGGGRYEAVAGEEDGNVV